MPINLGNILGVVKGKTVPLEADGVTQKKYILWAKIINESPEIYELHYFDSTLNLWVSFRDNQNKNIAAINARFTTLIGDGNDADNVINTLTEIFAFVKGLPEGDQKLLGLINDKEPKIIKKSGFNLKKTDEYPYLEADSGNVLVTAKGLATFVQNVILNDTAFRNLIRRVDGVGSLIDADLLDGKEGSYYKDWTTITNKPDPALRQGGLYNLVYVQLGQNLIPTSTGNTRIANYFDSNKVCCYLQVEDLSNDISSLKAGFASIQTLITYT